MERTSVQVAIIVSVFVTLYIIYKFTRTNEKLTFFDEFKSLRLSTKSRVDKYIEEETKKLFTHPRPTTQNTQSSTVSQTLIDELLLAARFALVAYETDDKLLEQQCISLGASYVGACNNGNCFMFVGDMGHTQILGIQGTEFVSGDRNIYQVWSDLSIVPKRIKGVFYNSPEIMYVHSGFYDDLVSLWPQVELLLDYNRPIHICCHSLGGVRGSLARYLIPRHTPVRITNFGAPKGANTAFWNYVYDHESSNTVIERVAAERDFGPSWMFGVDMYTHPTDMFYWLHDGIIEFVNKRDYVNLSFDDHSIVNSYIPKLLALSSTPK